MKTSRQPEKAGNLHCAPSPAFHSPTVQSFCNLRFGNIISTSVKTNRIDSHRRLMTYDDRVIVGAAKSDENVTICGPVLGDEELLVVPHPADVITKRSLLRHVVVTRRHRHQDRVARLQHFEIRLFFALFNNQFCF